MSQIDPDILLTFIEEVSDVTEKLQELLRSSEDQTLADDEVKELSRLLHNIKGTSASVGFTHFPKMVHHLEDFIAPFKEKSATAQLSRAYFVNLIGKITDACETLRSGLSEEVVASELQSTFDETFNANGILRDNQNITPNLKDQKSNGEIELGKSPQENKVGSKFLRVPEQVIENMYSLIEELVQVRGSMAFTHRLLPPQEVRNLSELDERLSIITRKLTNSIITSRLVSFKKVAERLERIADQYSRSSTKKIKVDFENSDAFFDKTIIDSIPDLLIHILKNSLDHGLESIEERLESKKAAEGRVLIRCERNIDSYLIHISDDGRGIDPDKVGKIAIKKNLRTQDDIRKMSIKDIQRLIFEPGFSTAEKITETSGRGVGMDAVVEGVSRLGGIVDFESEPGKGTHFKIVFPVSLKIGDFLIAKVDNLFCAFSTRNVNRVLKRGSTDHQFNSNKNIALQLNESFVPAISLPLLLCKKPELEKEIVICTIDNEEVAVLVEEIIGKESSVIKSIDQDLAKTSPYTGSAILSNGKVALHIDPSKLKKYIQGNVENGKAS